MRLERKEHRQEERTGTGYTFDFFRGVTFTLLDLIVNPIQLNKSNTEKWHYGLQIWILPSMLSCRHYQTHGNMVGDGGKNHSGKTKNKQKKKHTVISIYRAPPVTVCLKCSFELLSFD